jgi:putative membrane protein
MATVLASLTAIGDVIPIAHWNGDGPGWWIVFFPIFWILVITGIIFLVRGRRGGPPWAAQSRETGVQVLERRFAEGELSLEQYRERRAVLEEKR